MKWYQQMGPEGDVVISTRVRLARNIADVPFPGRMTQEQSKKVIDAAYSALRDSSSDGGVSFTDMQKLTPAKAMSLAEKHLISPEFAQEREGRALLLSADENVSIMLNEEDHIRIQAMYPGMKLKEALETANRYDDLLENCLNYAFNEELGYLTQCPTNLGTGLRASLMLHLPALAQSGAVASLAGALAKFGLTIRGTYGEGSQPKGSFYQISNQVTLGTTEQEAIENLATISNQIIAQEREARNTFKTAGEIFEDRVYRSYGTLLNARVLSGDEFMSLISDLRLGVMTGVISGISVENMNSLIYEVQPATLIASAGRNLDSHGRDVLRAKIVREKLQ